jgi:hypothetical protein
MLRRKLRRYVLYVQSSCRNLRKFDTCVLVQDFLCFRRYSTVRGTVGHKYCCHIARVMIRKLNAIRRLFILYYFD